MDRLWDMSNDAALAATRDTASTHDSDPTDELAAPLGPVGVPSPLPDEHQRRDRMAAMGVPEEYWDWMGPHGVPPMGVRLGIRFQQMSPQKLVATRRRWAATSRTWASSTAARIWCWPNPGLLRLDPSHPGQPGGGTHGGGH